MALPVAAALALTYSRASWLGLAVGILFLGVGRQRRALVILAVGFAAVVLLPQGRAILGRLSEAYAASDQASVMRLEEYRNAAEIIGRYPLLGIGFGGPPTVDLAPGVSSMYLLIAEQAGLLGLTCFLAIVVGVFVSSLRARPQADSRLHGMLSGLEAALIAMLTAGLFDHYFLNVSFPHMVGMFWLVAGLTFAAARIYAGSWSNASSSPASANSDAPSARFAISFARMGVKRPSTRSRNFSIRSASDIGLPSWEMYVAFQSLRIVRQCSPSGPTRFSIQAQHRLCDCSPGRMRYSGRHDKAGSHEGNV